MYGPDTASPVIVSLPAVPAISGFGCAAARSAGNERTVTSANKIVASAFAARPAKIATLVLLEEKVLWNGAMGPSLCQGATWAAMGAELGPLGPAGRRAAPAP